MHMINKELVSKAIEALQKNNFTVSIFDDEKKLVVAVMENLKNAKSISRGGSMTVEKLGLIDSIKEAGLPFRDYLTKEDRLASITAEYYLTGTNAITSDGKLVNIDGAGNRIAAMGFGPSKVLIISGVNKIVKDVEAGLQRIREVAGPLNAKRLNKKTPCATALICSDCDSPERICRKISIIPKPEKDRIHIYLLNKEIGF